MPRSLFEPETERKAHEPSSSRESISEEDILKEDIALQESEKLASAFPRRVESLGTDLSVGTKGFRVGGLTPRGPAVTILKNERPGTFYYIPPCPSTFCYLNPLRHRGHYSLKRTP